ncbi:SGNH hydrolase-type esterase domain-containing protein, partial [Coniochaeta sp. 2T2.1]
MAAIGDSYSAGIGAGNRLGSFLDALNSQRDWACSRYDHAYPYLVNNDPSLGDPSKRTFQFLSCSGALSKDVLEKQIPRLSSDQQAILLSVGGNDVELVNILNQCIFQVGVLNPEQVIVAKLAAQTEEYAWAKDFDFDTLGRGCAAQLDHTATFIGSSTFSQRLDNVLSAAKGKLAKEYGKFFAEDLSPDCNHVTWSTWIYKAANVFQDAQYLTQDNRRRMNGLVDSVNAQLKAAAERAGPSVVFVDYDSYVGEFHGRYCEAGVDEATTESNTRIPLMF